MTFRSLSRLSSALSAKASTLRSSLLDRFARSFGLACPTFFCRHSLLLMFSDVLISEFHLFSSLTLSYHFSLYEVFKVHSTEFFLSSGDEEIRTLDPLLARQVLSQLSYIPIFNCLLLLK